MKRVELPLATDDGLGEADKTQVSRRPRLNEAPVVVVRASFGPSALNHWVAQPGQAATIGRSTDVELVLVDPSVSRYHARIEVDAQGRLTLVDLQSTNGTSVNQRAVRGRMRIEPGDRVVVGDISLSIERMTAAELEGMRAASSRLRDADQDTLTGLVTRRWVEDHLAAWIDRQRQRAVPVCCLFVDLDGFKDVNDRAGHASGDQVLRGVADIVRRAIRDGDVAVRLGGDEIVVFLGKCRVTDGMVVAQRLCQAVAGHDFGGSIGRGRITLSIGVAEHRGEDAAKWLERADQALYRAKIERNCAVAAD
jgi:diguanylate cyclase (GGDEF)-like protein